MSTALTELATNLADVDRLLALCKPGRPGAAGVPAQAIYRSCLVLTVAFWERYVETVVREALSHLETHCPEFPMRPWLPTSLDNLNTPNTGNVERLLGAILGLIKPISQMTWQNMGTPHTRLNKLLERRHEVAHTGVAASPAWKGTVTRDRKFVARLAERVDEEVASRVEELCGTRPW